MKLLERALLFAEGAHGNQMYGKYPYKYHLKQVVEIAEGLGLNESQQAACALHDVIEDTAIGYKELLLEFGYEVADAVYRVSDELGRTREERKAKTYPKIAESENALLVKLCDRIANINASKGDVRNLARYQYEDIKFREALEGKVGGYHIELAWKEYKRALEEAAEH